MSSTPNPESEDFPHYLNSSRFDLERDTGLAAMVATAQPGDHGVIADWIEDHLQFDDLAAVLRGGQDDPRDAEQRQQTVSDHFRYRWLDRFVMVSMATYRVQEPMTDGTPKEPEPSGFVVCLCTPSTAPGGMRRWGRWLPEPITEEAILRLWEDLGKDVP